MSREKEKIRKNLKRILLLNVIRFKIDFVRNCFLCLVK